MRSRIPSHIRWTGHKKMEELLDDPLAESLYGLFLKVKDSPRHITIKPEIILNEVYLISNKIYQDAEPSNLIEDYEHEIESDMGWHYARELVMPMIYALIKGQKKKPQKVDCALVAIERKYHKSCYWPTFATVLRTEKRSAKNHPDLQPHVIDIAMKKLQAELSQYQNINPTNIYVTLNIQNDISGIDHLHLDHADVAVGVAEKGSNVYHHKKENHE